MFPLLGLALKPVLSPLVTPELYTGVLFLCVLPATVQSAIAFTSMARGNMPAAVCSASASTLLGMFVTPLLVSLIVVPHGAARRVARRHRPHPAAADAALRRRPSAAALDRRLGQAPHVDAQARRPGLDPAGGLHRLQRGGDRGPVAAGAAARAGRPAGGLRGAAGAGAVRHHLGWRAALGFDKADEITIVFCGSKKSLASGVPMAKVLFASQRSARSCCR